MCLYFCSGDGVTVECCILSVALFTAFRRCSIKNDFASAFLLPKETFIKEINSIDENVFSGFYKARFKNLTH